MSSANFRLPLPLRDDLHHSGYGEVVMSSSWKLLGPLETADGMLVFGVSTAIVISVIQLIFRTRFQIFLTIGAMDFLRSPSARTLAWVQMT